jgi:hypothetical protein
MGKYDFLDFIGLDNNKIFTIKREQLIWGLVSTVTLLSQYEIEIIIEIYDKRPEDKLEKKFLVSGIDLKAEELRDNKSFSVFTKREAVVMEKIIEKNLKEQIDPKDPEDRTRKIYFTHAIEACMKEFGFENIKIDEISTSIDPE